MAVNWADVLAFLSVEKKVGYWIANLADVSVGQ